jgi:hypothetical protein
MKDRVLHPNHYGYKWYAEKGITICDKWMSFSGFIEDMGQRPEGTTLDRIDNNQGYYKENCRWVSMVIQRRNRSDTKYIKYRDKVGTIASFCEELGLPYYSIKWRIYAGWSIEKAFETPIKKVSQ